MEGGDDLRFVSSQTQAFNSLLCFPLIEQAIIQTAQLGLGGGIARVPMPVWELYCQQAAMYGTKLDWNVVCGRVVGHDDEDVYICLVAECEDRHAESN